MKILYDSVLYKTWIEFLIVLMEMYSLFKRVHALALHVHSRTC